jgi:hypothetical protein
MDQRGEGASGAGPTRPDDAGDGEATQIFLGREQVTRPSPGGSVPPSPHPPTEVVLPHPPTEVVLPHPPTERVAFEQTADAVRSGPGIPAAPPASQAGLTAERVWRTGGRPPEPPRHPAKLRYRLGSALTVILLAATGVVLYLRFHHAPFHVTGVVISQQTRTACGADVTGRISTDGSAGTLSYQWLFQPGEQAPQPLSQSVIAGQHAVYVTVAVEGSGHGSASQKVTLQLLGPDRGSASADVVVSC